MVFTSYEFLLAFLPCVLIVVYSLSALGRQALAKLALVLASIVFYAWWNPYSLIFLFATIIFNYTVGSWLTGSRGVASKQRYRFAVMVSGVAVNIAALVFFKYTPFLMTQLNELTGQHHVIPDIVMPLGISFIVFQKIAFLVDTYNGEVEHIGALDYALFVCFFPQLISGPIVHHGEIIPQLKSPRALRYSSPEVAVAIGFLVIGAFKKIVIADELAPHVAAIFDGASAGKHYGVVASWGAAVAYTLEVYFDFSGYSDMAIGLGLLFGIRLPFNFNSPLKATSPIDYWGRWHITLTRFLTAYIYNPIAIRRTRRRMAARQRIKVDGVMTKGAFVSLLAWPTLITMALAGGWHGAGYQFVVFGLLHGVYLVINHAWRSWRPLNSEPSGDDTSEPSRARIWLCRAATLVAAIFAIPFFRADSVRAGWNIVCGMLGMHGVSEGRSLFDAAFVATLVGVLAITQLCPNSQEIMRDGLANIPALVRHRGEAAESALSKVRSWPKIAWAPTARWAIVLGLIGWYVVMRVAKPSAFLYFQF